jgi:hypothetical protein
MYHSCWIRLTRRGCVHFLLVRISFTAHTISLKATSGRDPRQPTIPIRRHSSTHSDDITTVSFLPVKDHPTGRNILLSGSTDGLLCTSYADEDDEDEAIIQVGNLGSSISQAGWIHGGWAANLDTPHAAIWAATDMETFSTWTSDVCFPSSEM